MLPAEEAGHNAIISRPFLFLSRRDWPSEENPDVPAAEPIGEQSMRKMRGGGAVCAPARRLCAAFFKPLNNRLHYMQ
jgi:hypothetical protein